MLVDTKMFGRVSDPPVSTSSSSSTNHMRYEVTAPRDCVADRGSAADPLIVVSACHGGLRRRRQLELFYSPRPPPHPASSP